MVSCFISRLVILIFGTLYPAYASYKAVRTKNVREYVKWMMYWIVFALFTCAETLTDLFLSFWFPFYYEIKIITVIYLLSPATKGSSILYRRFVHPVLTKREQDIDEYIAKAKEQGYHTMLNLGSKGVTYATTLIMQTAIKSGGGLVNHLRKSYSLSDLSEGRNLRSKEESVDDVDSSYGEDPRLTRRNFVPRRTVASPSQTGLYFPEVDLCERPEGEDYYRQIPSCEEISSGYSSGDPIFYPAQRSKGDNLVRTASLGPSGRVRTRAATRNGLPKRSSLSEGGSAWSAVESQGIQSETDHHSNFPLSHSASFPFPFPTLQHGLYPSEYHHLFGNLTQNQLLTFINHPAYSHILSTKPFESGKSSQEILESNSGNSKSIAVLEESSEIKGEKQSEASNVVENNGDNLLSQDVMSEAEKSEKDQMNVVDENSEKVGPSKDGLEVKEKVQERSGRYNKKPAPTPPEEENICKIALTVVDDEGEFFTPNASPNLKRKHTTSENQNSKDDECEEKSQQLLEVPKKSKSKNKKGDFNISKKLHMPKMSFSFWNQKGGKQGSGSETSSIASVEIPTKSEKNELEYFIPLKDDEDRTDENIGKGEGKD